MGSEDAWVQAGLRAGGEEEPEGSACLGQTCADPVGLDVPQRLLLCIGADRRRQLLLESQLDGAGWEAVMVTDLAAAEHALRERSFPVGLLVSTAEDDASWARVGDFLNQQGRTTWVAALQPAALRQPACRDVVLGCLFDHHHLPLDFPRLLVTLGHALGQAALRQAHEQRAAERADAAVIGRSPAAQRLLAQIGRVALVDAPVLVQGESGSGKELAAQAIHRHCARRAGPFVAVNCGALQSSLFQSELFGHVKGAFTGANRDKCGYIEAANGGTVFLDEIGDLPLELQVSLLRFLQERTIHRVGSTQSIPVDVRVIAATHVDLEGAIRAGRFREDLYYRLSVLPLRVPPLRERQEDIVLFAQHFYDLYAHERRPGLRGFSHAALASLQAHTWPGNVRELINRVRRALVMAEGRLIRPQDLGLSEPPAARPTEALDSARISAERHAIFTSLQRAGSNVTQAARELGISRMTLYRLMAKHGIHN